MQYNKFHNVAIQPLYESYLAFLLAFILTQILMSQMYNLANLGQGHNNRDGSI